MDFYRGIFEQKGHFLPKSIQKTHNLWTVEALLKLNLIYLKLRMTNGVYDVYDVYDAFLTNPLTNNT